MKKGPLLAAVPEVSLLVPVLGGSGLAKNALISLSTQSQRNIKDSEYEILVADGPSEDPIGSAAEAIGPNVRYVESVRQRATLLDLLDLLHDASRAPLVAVVDPTAIVTPRLLEQALLAREAAPRPVLVVPRYDLVEESDGGDAASGKEPGASLDWKADPYALFRIARFGAHNPRGYLCGVHESEWFFCSREMFAEVRSLNARRRIRTPGDVFAALIARPENRLIVLGGEAAFRRRTLAEVEASDGRTPLSPNREPLLVGVIPGEAHEHFRSSIGAAAIHAALMQQTGRGPWQHDPGAPLDPGRDLRGFRARLESRLLPERPTLSIVLVAHRIPRQIENTLYSLSARHQWNVREQDYEIIVVENRSSSMLGRARAERLGSNIRYFERDEPGVSPAPSMNFGAALARGRVLGLMIDGARMVTPRVVEHALIAQRLHGRPIAVVPGYHLGSGFQHLTSREGYDEVTEQRLLHEADWKKNGYRLFGIGAFDEASQNGFLNPLLEGTCLFCPKTCFDEIGGYDERFDLPGGGEVNHDLFARICRLPATRYIVLWGEGSFHQYHGGVSSSSAEDREAKLETFRRQHDALRGHRFRTFEREPLLLGAGAPEGHTLHMHAASLYGVRHFILRDAGQPEWPNG